MSKQIVAVYEIAVKKDESDQDVGIGAKKKKLPQCSIEDKGKGIVSEDDTIMKEKENVEELKQSTQKQPPPVIQGTSKEVKKAEGPVDTTAARRVGKSFCVSKILFVIDTRKLSPTQTSQSCIDWSSVLLTSLDVPL